MERRADARALQGGGSGEGFKPPAQLQNETTESRQRIADDIMKHGRGGVYKEHLFENTGNNDAEIWEQSLALRLETIGAAVPTIPAQGVSSSSVGIQSSVPPRQEIPGLPKSLDVLIELWRNGNQAEGCRPAHVYASVSTRRAIIRGYSNKTWVGSGQKRAFQMYQFLAAEVAKCNNQIKDIFAPGSSPEWSTALLEFKSRWNMSDNPIPLSTLERRLRMI